MARDRSQPRLGKILDVDGNESGVYGMLTRDSSSYLLLVPQTEEHKEEYRRWFGDGPFDSGEGIPDVLILRDVEGSPVALVGCHYGGGAYGTSSYSRIRASRAVFGVGYTVEYSAVHGMLSRTQGVLQWLDRRAMTTEIESGHRGLRLVVNGENQDAITVPTKIPLSLEPRFTAHPMTGDGEHVIDEFIAISTTSEAPETWEAHRHVHQAVEDLMTIAFWWPTRSSLSRVLHKEDLTNMLDGSTHPAMWREADDFRFGRGVHLVPSEAFDRTATPLFTFDDIGVAGLQSWIDEYDELGRSFWIIAALKHQVGSALEVKLLQLGAALEALAHVIDGAHGKNSSYDTLLRTITSDLVCSLDPVISPTGDADAWRDRFSKTYADVKHGRINQVESTSLMELVRSGSLLARLWLGGHLGASEETLDANAKQVIGHVPWT